MNSARDFLRMAKDAIKRAEDGLDSGQLPYACGQIGKATYYLSEARFAVDLKDLIEEAAPEPA